MQIRSTSESDRETFLRTLLSAFGQFPTPPAEGEGAWWSAYEMDRNLLATTDEDRPVGTAGAYTFELTLPGAVSVPVPGVTAVGVLPTHRRQGVLTALMRHQLHQLRAEGEFLSVLLASEAVIYRRFGYGPATYTQRLSVPRHRAAFATAAAPGTVELLERAGNDELLHDLYDRYRRTQPGALSRPGHWWRSGAGRPPVSRAKRHIALHRDADGTPDGYASYSVAVTDPVAYARTLTVDEVIATNDEAHDALARHCLEHDLVTTVVFANLPPEHPLRWQLADFRAAEVAADHDGLWVRLLDVPRALAARRYLADGELVLDVDDPFLRENQRYLLTVTNGTAECEPTDREPDLSLNISDLGSAYLGGVAPSTLVRAGRIRAHRPEAVGRADALFAAERRPHCVHWF
ncbi:GNAT family N-acetyltransferase [Kitasatospora sp. HPMI-4]|uniref:GNAT family N-acetyltransferase n=1 Tax=Kitasatospora sp. HPMI-4 TaxID=3448443 RepID=UPI003F1E2F60